MHLQTNFFKYDQEKELNAFLKTAHLYNTSDIPAITFKEAGVIVMTKPDPSYLDPFIAAETLNSTVTTLKERTVESESGIRQFTWRLEWKRTRKVELEKEIADAEGQSAAIAAQEPPKDKAHRAAWEEWQKKQKPAMKDLDKKLEKARKELEDITIQLETGEEHVAVTKRKLDDIKKDMDVAMAFAKEIESGEYQIYGQEPVKK